MCAHRRLDITILASYSRYTRSKPAQGFYRIGTCMDRSLDPFRLLATPHYNENCKRVLVSSNRCVDTTLYTRVKIRLDYIENGRWLVRDGAVTKLS